MASTRNSRGGSAMNYMLNLPRSLPFRRFDSTNGPVIAPASAVDIKSAGPLARIGSVSKPPAPSDPSLSSAEYQRRDRKSSGGNHSFGIYPSGTRHTYIYEPSLSSKSDLPLPSDTDSILSFPGDNVSVIARSSMETLWSGVGGDHESDASSDTESGGRTPRRVVIPVNLPALIEAQRSRGIMLALPQGSAASDSDSESTATGDYYRTRTLSGSRDTRDVPMPQTPGPRAIGFSPPRPDISGVIPITRAQSNGIIPPIDAAVYNRPPPSRRGSEERQPFPPGLSTSPQGISPSAAAGPAYPPIRRERRESFSVPPPARPNGGPGPSAVGRGDVRVEDPSGVRSAPPAPASRIVQPPTMLNRRPSLGARDAPSYIRPQPAPIQVSTRVRFDENLICPSPIPFHERRKGWFNARGDQLWTNLGAYKPAPAGQEYPTDLRHYPDYGSGWMNEECVRIDMQHRLVPKVPLRSALKKSRSPSDGNGVY